MAHLVGACPTARCLASRPGCISWCTCPPASRRPPWCATRRSVASTSSTWTRTRRQHRPPLWCSGTATSRWPDPGRRLGLADVFARPIADYMAASASSDRSRFRAAVDREVAYGSRRGGVTGRSWHMTPYPGGRAQRCRRCSRAGSSHDRGHPAGSASSSPTTTSSSVRACGRCSRWRTTSRCSARPTTTPAWWPARRPPRPRSSSPTSGCRPTFGREGIDAAKEVRKRHPGTGVVILSQYDDPDYAVALLSEGAAGYAYLLKDRVAEGDQLARAVREVASGGSMLDPKIVDALTQPVRTQRPQPRRGTPAAAGGRGHADQGDRGRRQDDARGRGRRESSGCSSGSPRA